ncbi:MAG: cobyrinate a,c-diamide synthase [Deferrisomatales bacterium]
MRYAFALAAPHSGAGKTTVTLAVLAALRRRGWTVQSFKVGPDYIDPAHHACLTGRPGRNLDTWMLPPEENRRIFEAAGADADVGVVEGVMGLFDGIDGRRPEGSTAHLARMLDLPVVLVVDARSMARSAAALVRGFATFDPGLRLAGVIWNRVGSATHRRILDDALQASSSLPGLGAVPRDEAVALPERHLGLVTPEDAGLPRDLAARLADLAEAHLDLDALLEGARRHPSGPPPLRAAPPTGAPARIGVARDAAYCFYYEDNLELLSALGAELVFFRPTDGDGIPPDLGGLYLGGGYPEVHGAALSRNRPFLEGLRALHERGVPIYAECGGLMTLCRHLEEPDGTRRPMAGVLPTAAHMRRRGFRLGYREVRVQGAPGLDGLTARGHEFHYSDIDPMPSSVRRLYRVRNARGEALPDEGYALGRTLASYVHLHFGSNPELPRRWFDLPGQAAGGPGPSR